MEWNYNEKECHLEENKANLPGLPENVILVHREQIRLAIEYNCIYQIKVKQLDKAIMEH